ncbi:MAG: DeoR family transcriptional regulator [Clostridia bacterium]|nr:DeoR family transcriptional regulator [Clostridia bacterium]
MRTVYQTLAEREHTVEELANKLFVSEPTVRRDILVLEKRILSYAKESE